MSGDRSSLRPEGGGASVVAVPRRWIVVACAVLAALAAGIVWVYTPPPLQSTGMHTRLDDQRMPVAYGFDLENTGRWPITLVAVKVDGQEISPPFAIAVSNFTEGHLAGSAAIALETYGHKLTTGPVYGWKMQPERYTGHARYAVRLGTRGLPPAHEKIILHHRYLGLPLRHDITPWIW